MKNRIKKILIVIFILICCFIFSQPAIIKLSGYVKDQSGNPIPRVSLSIGAYTTYTDQTGRYYFDFLTTDTYTIIIFYQNYIFQSFSIQVDPTHNQVNFKINLNEGTISIN